MDELSLKKAPFTLFLQSNFKALLPDALSRAFYDRVAEWFAHNAAGLADLAVLQSTARQLRSRQMPASAAAIVHYYSSCVEIFALSSIVHLREAPLGTPQQTYRLFWELSADLWESLQNNAAGSSVLPADWRYLLMDHLLAYECHAREALRMLAAAPSFGDAQFFELIDANNSLRRLQACLEDAHWLQICQSAQHPNAQDEAYQLGRWVSNMLTPSLSKVEMACLWMGNLDAALFEQIVIKKVHEFALQRAKEGMIREAFVSMEEKALLSAQNFAELLQKRAEQSAQRGYLHCSTFKTLDLHAHRGLLATNAMLERTCRLILDLLIRTTNDYRLNAEQGRIYRLVTWMLHNRFRICLRDCRFLLERFMEEEPLPDKAALAYWLMMWYHWNRHRYDYFGEPALSMGVYRQYILPSVLLVTTCSRSCCHRAGRACGPLLQDRLKEWIVNVREELSFQQGVINGAEALLWKGPVAHYLRETSDSYNSAVEEIQLREQEREREMFSALLSTRSSLD